MASSCTPIDRNRSSERLGLSSAIQGTTEIAILERLTTTGVRIPSAERESGSLRGHLAARRPEASQRTRKTFWAGARQLRLGPPQAARALRYQRSRYHQDQRQHSTCATREHGWRRRLCFSGAKTNRRRDGVAPHRRKRRANRLSISSQRRLDLAQ